MNGRTLIRLLLPALAVTLAAAACTKDLSHSGLDPESPVASEEPIEFAVGGGTKGQAPITSLAALAEQDFSVSAWYSPQGETFDVPGGTAVKYITNHRFGYVTSDLAGETTFPNPWQGVAPHASAGMVNPNPVYWPLDGTLTFFSYAPYRADAALETLPVPDTRDIVLEPAVTDAGILSRLPGYLIGSPLIRVTPAASVADQVDFLCAPPALDRTSAGGSLPLDFSRHRMTRVEFGFNEVGFTYPTGSVPEGDEVAVRVTSISLKNVIGSRFFYFKESVPYQTDCGWSDDVSPAAPTTVGADFPLATYQISADARELKSIAYYNANQVNVPERNVSNDNHTWLHTGRGLLFLLPQTLPADAKLEVRYSLVEQHGLPVVSEIVTCSLPTFSLAAWPEGKVVRYKLTLDIPARGVSNIVAQVYDWDDSGNSHNEELMPHD